MTTQATTKAKGQSKKARVAFVRTATFRVEKGKGESYIFRPVNKRAKAQAKLMGKRTRILLADLRAMQASGKVKIGLYTPSGELKAAF